MANDSWVGFAKSPKPDPNLSRLRVEASLEIAVPAERAFQLVTSAAGLSSWLQKTEKSTVQTSGKIFFSDVEENLSRAVFSLVEVGRRVVINSELFGEIEITLDSKKSKLQISFTKMISATERETQQATFESCLAKLRESLAVEK